MNQEGDRENSKRESNRDLKNENNKKPLYVRFKDVEDRYFYPGVIDHYPEGAPVSYGLTLNSVFEVEGFHDGLVAINSKKRITFESETIQEKGSLVSRLLQPFDSGGGPVELSVLPSALDIWVPQVGDEVFIDNQPAVICARGGGNGVSHADVLRAFAIGTPEPVANHSDYRSFQFSKNSKGWTRSLKNLSEQQDHPWGYAMFVKALLTPGPIYGETFGGAMEGYSFDPAQAKTYEFKDRDEVYQRVLPIFGRDKVDFCMIDGKVGLYRQHCGFRGCMSIKCIDADGVPLIEGESYTIDCISPKYARRVPVYVRDAYRAFNASRFDWPDMLK